MTRSSCVGSPLAFPRFEGPKASGLSSVRDAGARLGALAQAASTHADEIVRTLRAPESGPGVATAGGSGSAGGPVGAQPFLATPEGRAALEGALRSVWGFIKNWLAAGAPGPEQLRLPL
jgi:hypothetical protein